MILLHVLIRPMRRLRYLIMLLLALHALGMAGLDVTRNYVETGGGI